MAEIKKYALITGATGGLGKAFVNVLAEAGYDLLLTGRNEEKLKILQTEINQKYPEKDVRIYAADLSNDGGMYALTSKIEEEDLYISMLANVAGADIQKAFENYTMEKISFQCRVNFQSAVSLCHFTIKRKDSHLDIINVSSVSGIYPMPYFAIYSATKNALTSFSVALREEMKGKGVYVTAVLPGAMPTRADIQEQIKGQGLWGRLAVKSPEDVARASLKAVRKNKAKTIIGFWNKMMRVGTWWIPTSIRMRFIAKRWSKISKDAF